MTALVLAAACHAPPGGGPPAYVGATACQGCHPAATAAWSESPHAVAARPATAESVHAAYDGRARTFASLAFTPGRAGATFSIEPAGPDATRWAIDLVLGRDTVEQYVGRAPAGRWQALPVGYDPVARDWFDIFPAAPASDSWAHWQGPA